MARPASGLSDAIVPVSTSGMLVGGALAASPAGFACASALPKRWLLAIAATFTCAVLGGGGGELSAAATGFPPVRSVTIIAACTPKASASTHVAILGPWASASPRHRSGGGNFSNHGAAFIGWSKPFRPPRNQDVREVQASIVHQARAPSYERD